MGGLLLHMGGLGARTESDYKTLQRFVEQPWLFRVANAPTGEEDDSLDSPVHSASAPNLAVLDLEYIKPEQEGQRTEITKRHSLSDLGVKVNSSDLERVETMIQTERQRRKSSEDASLPEKQSSQDMSPKKQMSRSNDTAGTNYIWILFTLVVVVIAAAVAQYGWLSS